MIFTVFTVSYSHHHNFGYFYHPKKKPVSSSSHSPCFSVYPSALCSYCCVCMDLPILDNSYKRNHTICGLLWLAYFTKHNIFKVHSRCNMCQYFYCQVFYCKDIPYFIHSSVDVWVISTLCLWWIMLWTLYSSFYIDMCFQFSWLYTYEWDFWVMW